jgi:hypothetical protein
MRAGIALLAALAMLAPTLAGAQIYHWVDDEGVVHYTTGVESVPEPYRPNARLFAEPSDEPARGPTEPPAGPAPGPTAPAASPAPTAPPAGPAPGPTTPAAAPAPAGTTIAYTPGAPVLVAARVNGRGPVTLVLDTGADRTLIAPAALTRIGIPAQPSGQAVLRGVSGEARGDVMWVTSLEVGQARGGPIAIVVHDADLRNADGLLGRDFLDRFKVTIDARSGLITLAPH